MKKIKFLAVALAAFTLFSCSNDEIESLGNNAPGEQAVLTINLKGDGDDQAQSRALGSTTATEAQINDYLVFLFRDGGALDCPVQKGTSTSLTTTINVATTAAKNVYVVANTGELTQGPFASVKTEADLKNVTGTLMTADNSASTQRDGNLWMSGTSVVAFGGTNGADGTATVSLNFLAAKIELTVNDTRQNKNNGTIQIQDQAVVLLFAGKDVKFFGESTENSDQKAFYTGTQDYPNFSANNVTLSGQVLSDDVPISGFTNGAVFNHFYTFGNNGKVQQTILAIKSEKTVSSGAPSTIYYPLHFTMADAGATIEPGKHYKVTVTLSGDVEAGQGGGTTDPEAPVIKSNMLVTVEAAQWLAEVNVNKDFN